ncbi:MAG: M48 family metalloprotease [Alphaproteobacteria bacterium]|nr:M48 family metalloprotease [Alphaproteobacteria bacterium]MCB9697719.1 M48 family metalloprotease [Alphaproteobacteria bacterium]
MSRRLLVPLSALLLVGCEDAGTLTDINLFTVQDDIDLGQQLADEIAAHPEEYGVILDRSEYPDAYGHLDRIRDEILATGEVEYAKKFEWETHLIYDDATLNAFAAPGGFIYVYTGLLRYLEVEDHFAGVMGHEIAHAANRHSTEQLTKAYGITELLNLVTGGDSGLAGDIAAGLVGLEFSREDEAEADEYSVRYLCETDYAADGTAGFFEKLTSESNGVEIPEFLSTHPSSASRIEDIEASARKKGCDLSLNENAQWQAFLDSLPPEQKQ